MERWISCFLYQVLLMQMLMLTLSSLPEWEERKW